MSVRTSITDFAKRTVVNEPVVVRAILAIAAVAAAYGVPVDGTAQSIVEAFGQLTAIITVLTTRGKVSPVASPE